jgi:hypothetical protein
MLFKSVADGLKDRGSISSKGKGLIFQNWFEVYTAAYAEDNAGYFFKGQGL